MKYTRRRFISTLGAGSALIMASSIPGFSNNIFQDKNKKLGVALVGLGSYASYQLAPALLETSSCYLSGIVTGTPSKIDTWKNKYKIPDENIYNYDNFDKIINNKSIDVVYVVLPNSMHSEFTIRAAKAGKHVFCEKPMALSSRECAEMISACKNAGVRLFVGYRCHTDPFHKTAMNFKNTSVGALKVVQSEFGFRSGDPKQWRLRKAHGGGALMDVGIYSIQGSRYSIGKEPISVSAHEYKTDNVKFAEVDETMIWQMEFPGGIASSCICSFNAPFNRLHITAENGWFEINNAYSYGGLRATSNRGPVDIKPVNQQAVQMDTFCKSIVDGSESDADGSEGLRDMRIIEAIFKSAKSGTMVIL